MQVSKYKKTVKRYSKKTAKKSSRPTPPAAPTDNIPEENRTPENRRRLSQPRSAASSKKTQKSTAPILQRPSPFILLGIVAGILLLLIGFNIRSINSYYQQKYHSVSPLEPLEPLFTWVNEAWLQAPETAPEVIAIDTPASTPLTVENNTIPSTPSTIATGLESQGPQLPILQKLSNQEMGYILTPSAKVLFVGDSLMQGVAPIIASQLKKNYQIRSIDLSKQSTGLAYPKFHNWPQIVEQALQEDPDIRLIVVMLGANDPWDMPSSQKGAYLKFQSEAWRKEYLERIEKIYLAAAKQHVGVIWMDAPSMRKDNLNKGVLYLNTLYQEAAERFRAVHLVANHVFAYIDANYDPYTEIEGKRVKIRSDDGIHFTYAGQKLLASAILHRIEHMVPESTVPTLEEY